jgi:hypothetical protein
MIKRSLALLAAALGTLVLGLASTATVDGFVGVELARAQSTAPAAGTAATDPDPDVGLDDTATGTLDQGGLGGPVDDQPATGTGSGTGTPTGTGNAPAPPADPDAGLDDTPVGGLDDTDVGGPIDDTSQPATDPPSTTSPDPSPGSNGATTPPAGAAPSPASGAAPPVIYVVLNAPSSTPITSGRQPSPKPKSSKKHKTSKKKHKSSKKSKRQSKGSHSQRRSHKQTTSGRIGVELRPRPFLGRRETAAKERRTSTRG